MPSARLDLLIPLTASMGDHGISRCRVRLLIDRLEGLQIAPTAGSGDILDGKILPLGRPHASEAVPQSPVQFLDLSQLLGLLQPLAREIASDWLRRILWSWEQESVGIELRPVL